MRSPQKGAQYTKRETKSECIVLILPALAYTDEQTQAREGRAIRSRRIRRAINRSSLTLFGPPESNFRSLEKERQSQSVDRMHAVHATYARAATARKLKTGAEGVGLGLGLAWRCSWCGDWRRLCECALGKGARRLVFRTTHPWGFLRVLFCIAFAFSDTSSDKDSRGEDAEVEKTPTPQSQRSHIRKPSKTAEQVTTCGLRGWGGCVPVQHRTPASCPSQSKVGTLKRVFTFSAFQHESDDSLEPAEQYCSYPGFRQLTDPRTNAYRFRDLTILALTFYNAVYIPFPCFFNPVVS